ncbi:MAG TPA: VOC family protein [Candidatus Acidoferrum sp.]|nr:VOC family protein [Candidatus Acidoferrum sp.]
MQSRRLLRFLLFATLLATGAFFASDQALIAEAQQIHIRSIGPVITTVADMDRSVEFYSRVLTFEKMSDTEVAGDDLEHLFGVFGSRARIVRMRLGGESIELVQFLAPRGRPIPADSRSNDLWFQHFAVIVSDMGRAYAILRENKVEHASSGPQRLPDWNKNASGIEAFYFKDPDGHPLEILYFPPGKGDAKWQAKTDRVFLGIDHTAIAVSNTDASLKFYRDLLGLRVAGESENYGTEQEHLNNVFGARLRITALRAPSGPGIELLEYLSPRDGRPYPSDERANDLVHRQTELEADAIDSVAAPLRAAAVSFVSSSPATFHDGRIGFTTGLVIRDPDGHALGIVQR